MRSDNSSSGFGNDDDDDHQVTAIAKGGVACPFPWRLHEMLEATTKEGMDDIVSWQSHGRSFTVYKPKEFVEKILQRFFGQTKYASFQRQLNLYGFAHFSHGQDKGAYFHFAFVRGHRSLVREMVRRKIKGNKVRHPLLPSEEPNFYAPQWEHYYGSTPPETNQPSQQQHQHLSSSSSSSSSSSGLGTTMANTVPMQHEPQQRLIKKIGNKTLVDILPAPPTLVVASHHYPVAPPPPRAIVSPPVAPKAIVVSNHHQHHHLVPRSPSPPNLSLPTCSPSSSSSIALEAAAAAAYVEEDLLANDGDLLFFEGSPFHFLDDSCLVTTTTPSVVPQVCETSSCGGHFPQRNDTSSSSASSSVVVVPMHPNFSSLFAF